MRHFVINDVHITQFINKPNYKQNDIISRSITFHKTTVKVNYDLRIILQSEACYFHPLWQRWKDV